MVGLAGWGGLAGGLSQGLGQGVGIAQRAQQIQAAQFALDQQKRQLAGQAAAFQGLLNPQPQGGFGQGTPMQPPSLPGGMPPQSGQPPMPGQPSVPNQPPPQMPAGGGQQQPAPVPQPQPMPGQNAGRGQQPGGLPQDLTLQGQLNIIGQVAQAIKAQNPGIDPATLFEATKAQIGLIGSLSQAQRQQIIYTADQLKAQTSRENTQDRVGAQERGQDIGAQSRADVANINADSREKVAAGHDATSRANSADRIADADRRLDQTQAAINARQDKSLQGRASTKAQTERLALLRTKLSQAKQKKAAIDAQGGDDTQAQKSVDDAYNQILDFQTKVMGGKATPAAGKVTGGGDDPLGLR